MTSSTTQRWRNVHHVAKAVQDVKSSFKGTVLRPDGIMRESSVGGRFRRYFIKVGDVFGDLTAIEIVGQGSDGGYVWKLKCECGSETFRDAGTLNRGARLGSHSACSKCRIELRRLLQQDIRDALKEAYRKQWTDYGTLWLNDQTARLESLVRKDLEEEFGEVILDRDLRVSDMVVAVGFPYCVDDFYGQLRSSFGWWVVDRVGDRSVDKVGDRAREKSRETWVDGLYADPKTSQRGVSAEELTAIKSLKVPVVKKTSVTKKTSVVKEMERVNLIHLGREGPFNTRVVMRCGVASETPDGFQNPIQWHNKPSQVTCPECLENLPVRNSR